MKSATETNIHQLAQAAFLQAAKKLVTRAKQTGIPLIISVNGEMRAVPPEDLPKLGILVSDSEGAPANDGH
jgi:hypothetical protein